MTNAELLFFLDPSLIKRPAVTWLLQDEQPGSAVIEIQSQQLTSPVEVEQLQARLCDPTNPLEQRRAMMRLIKIGPAAVDALIEAFIEPCETCQVLAAYALRKLGVVALKPLLTSLDRYSPRIRQKAMWVLYSNNDPEVIDALITYLGDTDRKVRRYAAWGLGHLKNPRAIPALVTALGDSYEKVCFDAGMALVKIGGVAVDELLNALYYGNARTRTQVAAILAWLQDDMALDALIDALRDTNPNVRAQAALALGSIKHRQSVAPLMDALYDPDADVRMQAATSLGWIGDARAIDGLIGLIFDEDDWVPFSAADALGHLGDIRAIAPLMLASRGRNPHVRKAAKDALRQLGYLLN